ncbi:MAG: class I SAM-dependent methyltransferase, partial [Alphaproteobacteria bacterium]|nr:class I SAM-dependent methyltransferase [Alphaproteobacteria bacterium]
MSRLDSAIRRLEAQRACLGAAAAEIRDLPGPVVELGLGNGRTYDHLRDLLPGREIFAFDRQVAAHPDCVPDAAHMVLGDFTETVPGARAR